MERTRNRQEPGKEGFHALVVGKNSPDVTCYSSVADESHMLRGIKKCDIYFTFFQITTLICLTCAVAYSYTTIWEMKREIEQVKRTVARYEAFEGNLLQGSDLVNPTEYKDYSGSLLRISDISDAGEITAVKAKREITTSNEDTSENQSALENDKIGTLLSEEYSSELVSDTSNETRNQNSIPTTRKPTGNRRKSRKHNRQGVSAEKFFTQVESTTSTPIQIRRSRTKLTAGSSEKGKYKNSLDHKPLLHIYGTKESITREEAMRRTTNTRNLIAEKIPEMGHRRKDDNGKLSNSTLNKYKHTFITYNIVMVHFAADTSQYSTDNDPHYCGNGRMKTKTSLYKDWKATHWTQGYDVSNFFKFNHGKVTVSITGIYLIYAQIQYSNIQEVNGFAVYRNKQVVVHCITTSVHPDKDEVKSNTCDTSTTILLHADDKIYIEDLHHGRHVVLTPEKSYFGLILLSPFKENEIESQNI